MRSRKFSVGFMALAIVAYTLGVAIQAAAQTETVYFLFGRTPDNGYDSYSGVVRDSAGNFYGTTVGGGNHLSGTVYELSPNASGEYEETVLHNFQRYNSTDGWQPFSGVILDASGNVYGTAESGGTNGFGMVFELTPGSDGQWTETVLHNFTLKDGARPWSALIADASGNLYGTAAGGGKYASGVVFELMRVNGGWVETTLHDFNPHRGDGYTPIAGLTLDAEGNLYGTTSYCQCGYSNDGTVFELKHGAGGGWTEEILHSFINDGVQGFELNAGVTMDSEGNLYGATTLGGSGICNDIYGGGCGTVFKLAPLTDGTWAETTIHDFQYYTSDGILPYGTLVLDAAGNLYGTTVSGGAVGSGTVFELTRSNGAWTETILHNFFGFNPLPNKEGAVPYAGVVFDNSGNIYGTTNAGGYGSGVFFEITP